MILTTFETGEARAFTEISREFGLPSFVARHPVLGSSATSDNVEPMPRDIRVEIVEPDLRYGTEHGGLPIEAPQAGSYLYDALAFLQSIRANRLLIQFSGLPVFRLYVMEDARLRKGKRDRWTISASFIEFVEARSSQARIPPSVTNNSGGADRQNLNQQTPKPARDGLFTSFLKQIGAVE